MLVAMIGDKLTRRSLAGQRSWRTQHTRRMQSWRIQSGEENENCLEKRNLAIALDFNMKYGETVDKPGLSKNISSFKMCKILHSVLLVSTDMELLLWNY